MTLDEQAQLVDARIFLVQLHQGQSFAKLRRRGLGAAAEALQNGVVVLDRLGIVLLAVSDFAGDRNCAVPARSSIG